MPFLELRRKGSADVRRLFHKRHQAMTHDQLTPTTKPEAKRADDFENRLFRHSALNSRSPGALGNLTSAKKRRHHFRVPVTCEASTTFSPTQNSEFRLVTETNSCQLPNVVRFFDQDVSSQWRKRRSLSYYECIYLPSHHQILGLPNR